MRWRVFSDKFISNLLLGAKAFSERRNWTEVAQLVFDELTNGAINSVQLQLTSPCTRLKSEKNLKVGHYVMKCLQRLLLTFFLTHGDLTPSDYYLFWNMNSDYGGVCYPRWWMTQASTSE